MIIKMDKQTADAIRGIYGEFWGLTPCEVNGAWYLPVDILNNPAYNEVHELLSHCETVEDVDNDTQ